MKCSRVILQEKRSRDELKKLWVVYSPSHKGQGHLPNPVPLRIYNWNVILELNELTGSNVES